MAVTNGIVVGGSTSVAAPADFQSGGVIYSNDMNAALRNASIGSSLFYSALAELDTSATSYTVSNALDTSDASVVTAIKNSLISAFQKTQNKFSLTIKNKASGVSTTTNFDGTSAVGFTLSPDQFTNDSGTIEVQLPQLKIIGLSADDDTASTRTIIYEGISGKTIRFDENEFWIDSNNVVHLRHT